MIDYILNVSIRFINSIAVKKRIMKIMLVYPPAQIEDTYSNFAFAAPVLPPLGLAYIVQYFCKKGLMLRLRIVFQTGWA